MGRKLFRSSQNKMLAGVCAGLGEYFEIDPTIIRIIWCAATLYYIPTGILGYIIAAIMIPESHSGYSNSGGQYNYENYEEHNWSSEYMNFDSRKTRLTIGGILIALGVFFLAKEVFHLDAKYFLPLVFIAIGIAIIYKGGRKKT